MCVWPASLVAGVWPIASFRFPVISFVSVFGVGGGGGRRSMVSFIHYRYHYHWVGIAIKQAYGHYFSSCHLVKQFYAGTFIISAFLLKYSGAPAHVFAKGY